MPSAGDLAPDDAPFAPAEIAAMFATVVGEAGHVGLAVSGGSDSMGLLVLFAQWLAGRQDRPPRATVLTVDHGLRAESAGEARLVAAQAERLGLPHATLPWTGEKPATGLAAAARMARYGLLGGYARRHGIDLVLTGHTRDDQAETLLMRLARGSGVDGLAAMPALGTLAVAGHDLRIGRPLLAVSKARLVGALRAHGICWSDDPTNLDPAYERPRLRATVGALRDVGLTPAALAESARRLRRARAALEAMTLRFFDPALCNARVDPLGYVDLSLAGLRDQPDEISLRVLRAVIQAVGGAPEPASLRALEDLHLALRSASGEAAFTLARAAVGLRSGRVHVEREPGRQPTPAEPLAPGCTLVWDGRFHVTCGASVPTCAHVRALGAEGLARAEALGLIRPVAVPARVLRALPAIWEGEGVLAVPNLEFSVQPELQLDIAITFLGLRDLCPGRA